MEEPLIIVITLQRPSERFAESIDAVDDIRNELGIAAFLLPGDTVEEML